MGMEDAVNYFHRLDAWLMHGATLGIQTWNWVTGGTREGLAHSLLAVSSAILGTGFISQDSFREPDAIPFSLMSAGITAILYHSSQRITEMGERFRDADIRSAELTQLQDQTAAIGYFLGLCSLAAPSILPLEDSFYAAATTLSQGASAFVMSSPTDPPRKHNCVVRGYHALRRSLDYEGLNPVMAR